VASIIRATIGFSLANYSLTFFVIGLLAAAIAIARAPRPLSTALIVEKLLCWYVFFAIGIYFLYNFIMHVFFGRMSAAFIGWADSPFQFEVGMARCELILRPVCGDRGQHGARSADASNGGR